MAIRENTFLLKRSNVPSKVPLAGDVQLGELALNTADVKLYASGTTENDIVQIGWDRINRTGDTVTGDFIFNGGITATTISATTYLNYPTVGGGDYLPLSGGTVTGNTFFTSGLTVNTIDFNTTATTTSAVGRLRWDDVDGTLELGLKGGNVNLQIGQEQVARVVNKTGSNLLESQYSVVRIRRVDEGGSQGQRLAVVLAQANNDANSVDTLGIVTENINVNQEGFITTSGLVNGIDTTGSLQGETWVDGDLLYLSPTTPGVLTKVKPIAPQHTIIMGYVVYAHNNNGKIFVKVDNGYELDELHNVKITTPSNNDLLTYNSSTSVWENKPLTQSDLMTKLGFFVYNRISESSAVTGVVTETIIENILIPANTYLSGGILRLYNLKVRKVGAVGVTTAMRIYIGPNSSNLTGATQIAIYSALAANFVTIEMLRTFTCTTTGILGFAATSSSPVDTGTGAVARLSANINWSIPQYIIITVQPASASDSYTMIGASIKNF